MAAYRKGLVRTCNTRTQRQLIRRITAPPAITAMEAKVAVNEHDTDRLMESPGPGHGHRGFLVQRNHESGGIVIGVTLPRGAALQQRVEATSCNRDIFTIPKSGKCNFQIRISGPDASWISIAPTGASRIRFSVSAGTRGRPKALPLVKVTPHDARVCARIW